MKKSLAAYKEQFYKTLMEEFVPFWEKYSPDPKYGGVLCGFDRDGSLFYEDKSVWQQGRSLWMFSKLYSEFGGKHIWLKIAASIYDFINKFCFDEKGHMYFKVTRDGKPLVNRRYYFSEAFAIMGYVEYYKVTGQTEVKQRALDLFDKFHYYYITPNYFPPKIEPTTRKNKSHSIVMIMLNVCQHMRTIDNNPLYDELITESIHIITTQFVKEDEKVLLETVGSNGERIHSPEGRLINPGHTMETCWFLMVEAIYRQDPTLMEKAIQINLWALERGWDEEMGGIFYFQDVENKPVMSLEWDMKLLWPHCEAMIALLYSFLYTKDEVFMQWFERISSYVYEKFPDEGYPEWYGHLHRDGTPISQIKGSDWKGPFHNVRAFMIIVQLMDKIIHDESLFLTFSITDELF